MAKQLIKKVQELMKEREVDLVILWPSANWRYLVPFAPIAEERLTLLLVALDKICAVVPDFERAEFVKATQLEDVFPWSDEQGPESALSQAWEAVAGGGARSVAVDDTMPFLFWKFLEPYTEKRSTQLARSLMMKLRQIKEPEEIAAIKETARLIERAIDTVKRVVKPGMTERELELLLRCRLIEEGAGTTDYVLVQAAPNSASPHHLAGSKAIEEGEPVLLDIAVSKGGYYADITRQICVGRPSAEYRQIFDIVQAAQDAAVRKVRPDVTGDDIDATVRGIMREAGKEEVYLGIGHGIGLEVHEPPRVVRGDPTLLKPGMVFTIEPGIYLPGQFGVRIEDTVAVTSDGVERLTESDRDLIII